MMRKHVLCIFFGRSCFKIRPTPPWTAKKCLVKRRDEKVSEIGNGVVFPDAAKKAKVDLAFLVIEAVSEAKKLRRPAASSGVSELGDDICLKAVTPECFYRGSSQNPAWIPAKSMRE